MLIKKSLISFIILVFFITIPVLYQNCASSHSSGSSDFNASLAAGKCGQVLVNGFSSSGYYDFVKTNCADCHFNGGPGAGSFADENGAIAADAFILKGEEKIAEFATSTHKAGYTGPQHDAAVMELQAKWDDIETQFIECKTANNEEGGINLGGGNVTVPDKFTIGKAYNADVGDQTLMSWDLGSQMEAAGNNIAGVTFEMTMEAFDVGGDLTGYYFYAPRIIVAGASPIYIKGVGVRINGTLVSNGSTFYTTERFVPANDSRQLAANGGAIVAVSAIAADVNISIGFSQVMVSPITFQPPTWDDLTNAGGLFAVSCAPCHTANNSGGFNLSNANYGIVVGGFGNSGNPLIQKYNLDGSLVHLRMNDAAGPMPTGGLLPQADRDRVRDWILDGAPEDNNAVDAMR